MSDDRFPGDATLLAQLAAESAFIALTSSGPSGQRAMRLVVDRPIDCGRLMHLAARERAVVAVNEQLARTPIRGPLPAELANLNRLAMVSEFQLSSLHDRLVKLLALYAAHDIDVLLLKGAGLAHSAYARPNERPMGDIDLLVRKDTASRAWELALANGWARRGDVPEERSYAEHQHLSPLEDADGLQIGLELHTALFTRQAPFRVPPEQLWEGARRLTIGGQPAYVPSPENQLLHAALHFAWSHEMTFGAFRTLRDVERILAASPIDWPTMVRKHARRAARRAATGPCGWRAIWQEWTVPPEVLAQLAPRLPERVLRALTRYFAEHALPTPDLMVSSVSLSRALWSLGVRPAQPGPWPLAAMARHGGMGPSARRHEEHADLGGEAAHPAQLRVSANGREPAGPMTDDCARRGNRLPAPWSRQPNRWCGAIATRVWERPRDRRRWRVRCLAVTVCRDIGLHTPLEAGPLVMRRVPTGYVRCLNPQSGTVARLHPGGASGPKEGTPGCEPHRRSDCTQ